VSFSRSLLPHCHAFFALVIALHFPKPALAQEPSLEIEALPERFRLVYAAPADCPNWEAFSRLVRERIPSDWEASPAELARTIDVDVSRRGDRYLAVIAFSTTSGELVTRAVTGVLCADVVNGIALVTALAIRARGAETFEQGATGAASGPESSSVPRSAADAPPAAAKRAASLEQTTQTNTPTSPLHLRVGLLAAVVTGVGPDAAFGAGLFAALEWPSFRLGLGVQRFDSGPVRASDVPAAFSLLSARVEGCPAFQLGSRSALEPCAFAEIGSFHAEAQLEPPRVSVSKPAAIAWVAPGLLGRWILRLDPILVELEVLGRFPLYQEKFYVQSEQRQVIFRVPVFSAGAALGLGLRF